MGISFPVYASAPSSVFSLQVKCFGQGSFCWRSGPINLKLSTYVSNNMFFSKLNAKEGFFPLFHGPLNKENDRASGERCTMDTFLFLSSLRLLSQKARHRNGDPAAAATALVHFLKALYFRRRTTWMLHTLNTDALSLEVSVCHMSIVLELIFMVQWLLEKKLKFLVISLILWVTMFSICVPWSACPSDSFHLTSPSFHGSVKRVKFLVVKSISQILYEICLVYLVYGRIVRCTCPTGRCHLILTSFPWFNGQS